MIWEYAFYLLFLASPVLATTDSGSSYQVEVEQGWLEGKIVDMVTGDGQFYSFKGIPYATPPVGTLRFKAPQPPLPWEGVRNASEHGPSCPQLDIFTDTLVPGSEDCLHLNVYTADITPQDPLPVMVFIHGGGFKSGSGNDSYYGADFLVQHGVVVVTMNYRLDALGFLCLDTEEVPGNAGLKDQVAALKWVQKNIAKFGGDPDNVTIFGQSAGGASVPYHVMSSLSKGLFKRAISMSGVPSCDWSISYEPVRRAFIFGEYLGIYTNDTTELLNQLQALPVENLVDIHPAVLETERTFNIFKTFYFAPVIETNFTGDHILTEDIEKGLEKGKINDVDLMFGHTNMEGISAIGKFLPLLENYDLFPETLVPRKILQTSSASTLLKISDRIRKKYFGEQKISNETLKELITFINPNNFEYHIRRLTKQLPNIEGHSKYFYRFSAVTDRNVFGSQGIPYGLIGAGHLDDVFHLMDPKEYNLTITKDSKEYNVVNLICTLFTNFAKYGNPTPDDSLGVVWEQYDSCTDTNFLDIGETLTLMSTLNEEEQEFWQSIYDEAGV